jgi:hypothetical protein
MRTTRPLAIGTALLAMLLAGCSADAPSPLAPSSVTVDAAIGAAADITVSSSAELVAALVPANAGKRIRVTTGTYAVTQPLTVPDGATLEGDGVMQFDGAGRPIGFAAGSRTAVVMTANIPGDLVTLEHGATVRQLALEDVAGRPGNVVGIVSRAAGDRISATISEVEIVNRGPHAIAMAGPVGCGVAVVSRNPNLGAEPAPHAGAAIDVRMTRSIVRSTSTGTGCGLFAFNFAPAASVSVDVSDNVIGGGIIASGGVSRPDAVYDATTTIQSHRNLYRDDSPSACATPHLGWNLQGGSGIPAPLQIAATVRNALRVQSVHDRIEGFATAVLATGGRRFFGAPTAGETSDNSVDLDLLGTTVSTPECGAGVLVIDFRLSGALVSNAALVPGNGNTLRALFRNVTGSGPRANVYADVLGPNGPQPAALSGTGNRLELIGNARAFEQTNSGIAPAPPAELYTADE